MSYSFYNQQSSNLAQTGNQNQQYSYGSPSITQPLFPQPSGNVYHINNTLEVANVPVGAGLSIALCLPENLMYIKMLQNGNPMFWAYRISPYEQQNEKENKEIPSNEDSNAFEELKIYKKKVDALEKQIAYIKKELGGHDNEEF